MTSQSRMAKYLVDDSGIHSLPLLIRFMLPPHSLKIADRRQRLIFRFREGTFGGALQQNQFLAKQRGPRFGQRQNQVFHHGTQTPRDLDTRMTELTNLGDGQADEILPVRSAVHESKVARSISHVSVSQAPITHLAEERMDLV